MFFYGFLNALNGNLISLIWSTFQDFAFYHQFEGVHEHH